MKYIILCIVNAIFLITGQILFKMGMKERTFDSVSTVLKIMLTSLVLPGLIIYACATVLWLYILSRVPISRAYPIQALVYPAIMVLAKYFFNEEITIMRWIGAGIICIGIVVVSQ